ncbi:MAG: shikimate dehydrogenase [Candidatus Omnitrophica bacterium]|nr:shikimate dehydrogenase [Candidatus Omnitrophota bacterium]
MDIRNVVSKTGLKIDGIAVMCPYVPKQMVTLGEKVVLKKIISSVRLAKKLGAGIVGLGGFTSIVGNEGEIVAKEVDVAVTSGNTYTAALALQGIEKAAQILERPLESSVVAVIGATGDIGGICAKILSRKAKTLILCARKIEEAVDFISVLKKSSRTNIIIEKYADKVASQADFIISATSAATTIISPQNLRPGAVVCDVSLPPDIAKEVIKMRNDVFVFDGGKASFLNSGLIESNKWKGIFPNGIIYGCLAETMILALEQKFVNFSIGRGNITEDKIKFISELAERHGFSLAPFHCGRYIYTQEDIQRIKNLIS